jgi:hypothetical protein
VTSVLHCFYLVAEQFKNCTRDSGLTLLKSPGTEIPGEIMNVFSPQVKNHFAHCAPWRSQIYDSIWTIDFRALAVQIRNKRPLLKPICLAALLFMRICICRLKFNDQDTDRGEGTKGGARSGQMVAGDSGARRGARRSRGLGFSPRPIVVRISRRWWRTRLAISFHDASFAVCSLLRSAGEIRL